MKLFKASLGVLMLGALALTPLNSGAEISKKPKILLHIKSVVSKAACSIPAGLGGLCANADITGDLNQPYHMLVLVDLGDSMRIIVSTNPQYGLAGLQFGISYPGSFDPIGNGSMINVFSWTHCGGLEFPMPNPVWPAPGGGNLIIWDPVNACQRSLAAAGYFYLTAYAAGTFQITPRPAEMLAKIGSCDQDETILSPADLGSVHFSAGGGASAMACNPCIRRCVDDPVAVAPTTWSKVKTLLN